MKKPTKIEVREALRLISDPNTARLFYHGLKNPHWVELLDKEGVFRNLPPVQKGSVDGSEVYPFWPQSRYLANAAEGNPEAVYKVFIRMDKSNHYILRDIVEAASRMPVKFSEPLAKNIEGYLKKRKWFDASLCTSIVGLIEVLIAAGRTERANALAKSLLYVQPSRIAKVIEFEGYQHIPDPDGKMDDWYYNNALKALLKIWDEYGVVDSVKVLATLLDAAIYIKKGGTKPGGADGSVIWLADLKSTGQSYENHVHQALGRALRELSASLMRKNPENIVPVFAELEERRSGWMIFRRILLSLGEEIVELDLCRLIELVRRPEDLNEIGVYPEYWGTLSVTFGQLPADTQEWVLAKLKAAPIEEGENEEDRQAWIYRRLYFIGKFLKGEDLAYLEKFGKKFPRPKLELVSSSVSYVGYRSPKKAEDLLAMPADELLSFLKTWRTEDGDPYGPSEEGLKRNLEEAISKRAVEFALLAYSFTNLAPTYFRGLVDGLAKALKEGVAFSQTNLLDAAEIVALKPANKKMKRSYSRYESDPGWDWAKGELTQLLENLVQKNIDVFSDDEKVRLVGVFENILKMDYPEEEEFVSKKNETMNGFEKSLNSVKGKAMNALISLMTKGSEATQNEAWHKKAFFLFGECLQGEGPYQNIYAASWGHNFNSFFNQHFIWLKEETIRILDTSKSKRQAAFYAFVKWNTPHSKTFALLRPYYEKAIQESVEEDVSDNLAEHLVSLQWSGTFDSPSDDILMRYWRSAEEGPRQHMVWFVGSALTEAVDDSVPAEIKRRLEDLGRKILALQGAEAPSIKTKASFGYWIASGKLSSEWVLDCLEAIETDPAGYFNDLSGVLTTLSQSSNFPVERVSKFISGYFTSTRQIEELVLCKELLLEIMLRCKAGASLDLVAKLKTAANRLGKRGFLEFKKVALD